MTSQSNLSGSAPSGDAEVQTALSDGTVTSEDLLSARYAHTPGPWLLATSNSWRRFVTKFDTRSVCEPVTYSDRDRHPDLHFPNGGQDGPDARLMAAAPDLLAASRKALGVLAGEDMTKQSLIDALTMLRAAISLASIPKEPQA